VPLGDSSAPAAIAAGRQSQAGPCTSTGRLRLPAGLPAPLRRPPHAPLLAGLT
jgi:hypothetical protein